MRHHFYQRRDKNYMSGWLLIEYSILNLLSLKCCKHFVRLQRRFMPEINYNRKYRPTFKITVINKWISKNHGFISKTELYEPKKSFLSLSKICTLNVLTFGNSWYNFIHCPVASCKQIRITTYPAAVRLHNCPKYITRVICLVSRFPAITQRFAWKVRREFHDFTDCKSFCSALIFNNKNNLEQKYKIFVR